MRTWNYAQLSMLARQLGGPEEMIRLIRKAGVAQGRLEMLPLALVFAAISSGITWYLTYKNQKAEEEAERAEAKILRMTTIERSDPDNADSATAVDL